ncbi:hypothetical protein HKD37_11G032326 [Glycine soja]|nr:hypothetical protein JHK87_031821 [Glycine soja]
MQALLRLKLLQRGTAANDSTRQKSIASEVNNRQPQGSAIMQLRESFSSGAELRTAVQAEVANPKSPQRGTTNKTTQLDNSATTDHLSKDTSNNKGHGNANHATESTQKSVSQTRIDHNL